MAARFGDRLDQEVAQLARELNEIAGWEAAQISRASDGIEERRTGHDAGVALWLGTVRTCGRR